MGLTVLADKGDWKSEKQSAMGAEGGTEGRVKTKERLS